MGKHFENGVFPEPSPKRRGQCDSNGKGGQCWHLARAQLWSTYHGDAPSCLETHSGTQYPAQN